MIEKMKRNRAEIEEKLNDGREKEGILHSVFESDQPDGFLQVQTLHSAQFSAQSFLMWFRNIIWLKNNNSILYSLHWLKIIQM